MTVFKMEYQSDTGELTIFVGAPRVTINILNECPKTAFKQANEINNLVKFAYSEGARDATKEVSKSIFDLTNKFIIQR